MRSTFILGFLGVLVLATAGGCARMERVQDVYEPDYYRVPKLLADSLQSDTVTFIVAGDVQSAWRAEVDFYRRENWATWKQALFPFYQLRLLANGISGAINYKRQKPDSGEDFRRKMRTALRTAADAVDANFWMVLGDLSAHDGRYAEHWASFLDEYLHEEPSLLREFPFLPVIGNHEYANDSLYGWANYDAIFEYPRFYVQDTPDLALFVLNSNFIVDQHDFLADSTQERLFAEWFVSDDAAAPSWLERELEKRKDRPFKMVAMHHPLLSFSWHFRDWERRGFGPGLIEKRRRLLDLLQAYDVQVLLGGHEHVYEHSLMEYVWDEDERALHQVVTSGGGVSLRSIAPPEVIEQRIEAYREQGIAVAPIELFDSAHHYTVVRVTPELLVLETFAVPDFDLERTYLIERIEIAPHDAVRVADDVTDQAADES